MRVSGGLTSFFLRPRWGEGEGQLLAMTEGNPSATPLGTPTILANDKGQASVF